MHLLSSSFPTKVCLSHMITVQAPGVECPGVEARLDPGLHRRMVPAPSPVTGVTPLTGMFPLNTDTGQQEEHQE